MSFLFEFLLKKFIPLVGFVLLLPVIDLWILELQGVL